MKIVDCYYKWRDECLQHLPGYTVRFLASFSIYMSIKYPLISSDRWFVSKISKFQVTKMELMSDRFKGRIIESVKVESQQQILNLLRT